MPIVQNHRNFIITISAFIAGTIILAIFAMTMTKEVFADSGVMACKTMADNMTKNKNDSNDTKISDVKYHQIRKPFEKSRYADIRVAGTNLIDTLYKIDSSSKSDQTFGNAIVLMGTVQSQWGQLQTACGNHNVAVPALPLN